MTVHAPIISLSIVSHGQGALIEGLLADIEAQSWNDGYSFEVIITLNISEDEAWLERDFDFPLIVLRNDAPEGFGTNHNRAFAISQGQYFAVVNPDIRLTDFRISPLLHALACSKVGVCGPLVRGPDNSLQDSARRFPTIRGLILRKLLRRSDSDYAIALEVQQVDWLAGMFLLFPAKVYRAINGFDGRYFMYMEDVEVGRYLRFCGFKVVWVTSVCVFHAAARASRSDLQHMRWHVSSAIRYFFTRARRR